MDHLARPPAPDGLGSTFVRNILVDGSWSVVAPLVHFLNDGPLRPPLRSPGKNARAALLADISHFMHILHGRHPGLIEYASQNADDAAQPWLMKAMDGMLAERIYLYKLTVTAGPIRRLPGQDKISSLVECQAKNFQMLATSGRQGCSSGAAIAFVLDWHQTRPLLDIVAQEMGLMPKSLVLPSVLECQQLAEKLNPDVGYRRAMAFGADQTLAQQRGLWQLIVARHVETLAG
ncbi:DUF6975 family protein [Sphingorhabdus sp.]|uniref:DUF6975 family protein n=1 Tax=Sphingorhabdus sp. TaxID=1902408 RepID=UPI0039831249